jgi:hypothetical protein
MDQLTEQVRHAEADHLDPDFDASRRRHEGHAAHAAIFSRRADAIARNLATGWHGQHPTFDQVWDHFTAWGTAEREHYLSRTHYRDLLSLMFGDGSRVRADAAKAMEQAAREKFASLPDDVRDLLACQWGWESPAQHELAAAEHGSEQPE